MSKKILTIDNARYAFVPAACFPPKHSGLGIYVRHKHKHSQSIVVKEYKNTHIHVDCPDREVLMVNDHNKLHAHIPFDGGYDEFYDLNYMNEDGNDDVGILMFNHLQHEGQPSPNIRRDGVNPDPQGRRIEYVADSGGFQLMSGQTDFIDPRDVADWYGKNIDMGMVLDIPIHDDQMPIKMVQRLARVQKQNSDVMLEMLPKHVELINIVHGISPQQKKAYGEIVKDDRIRRLAMGGMYYQNVVFTTNDLYTTLMENTHYKHLHILGVYNVAQMAILIRLANSPINNMLITSDASTPIQSARSKLMHIQAGQRIGAKRLNIGDADRVPTIYNNFNCQCKVCRALKYTDILSSIDGATTSFLLAYHNAYEIVRFSRQLNDICATASPKEYKEVVKSILKNHRSASYTLQSLDFIDYADNHGIVAARKRYQHYLNVSSILRENDYSKLFSSSGTATKSEDEQAEDKAAAEAAANAPKNDSEVVVGDTTQQTADLSPAERLVVILEKYEKYHRGGLSDKEKSQGKKAKKKKTSKKGSGRAAGNVKKAGLKTQVRKKSKKS